MTLPWFCARVVIKLTDSHNMERSLKALRGYRWIVADPDLLGGKPAIRGTRFSVSFILACLAEGMSAGEIEETYGVFPHEAIPEILKLASELADAPNVAA